MAAFPKVPSFKTQSPFSPIERICARLVTFGEGNEIFVQGTCVRLAQNLYLTARHVLTDFADRYGRGAKGAKFTAWAVHVLPGPEYAIWQIDRFWLSPHSDLAVFHTTPYNDTAGAEKITQSVGIDLRPPPVGSRVVGFGHHSPAGQIRVGADGTKHIEINTDGTATVGEVREIHPLRRDSVKLNFPCFRVNARFDGGMSGGPVFGDNGRVCGIICSTFPASCETEEHCSYVATLWPLMGLGINANPAPYRILDHLYPFIDLARQRVIDVEDLQSVSVRPAVAPGLCEVTIQEQLVP